MSGGVDSAVAAARAVDAGHDVTGMHLALSRNPKSYRSGARGCCTIEDAHDARRAADVHRDPLLRLGPERALPRGRGRGLRRRVRRGPHPEPVPALQRADQVRRRARPRARARLRRRRHRPLRPARSDGRRSSCTARSTRPRTSPTCSACSTQEQLRTLDVPAGRHRRRPRSGRRRPRAGSAVADKPDSHDICFIPTATPAAGCATGSGAKPGDDRRRRRRRGLGEHDGAFAFTVGQRRGPADRAVPPPDGRPALRPGHLAGDGDGDRRPGRGARRLATGRGRGRLGASRGRGRGVPRPGASPRRAPSRPSRRPATVSSSSSWAHRCEAPPRARPSFCTTPTASSAVGHILRTLADRAAA